MADFCKQCSYVMFGTEPDQYDNGGDLQGIITAEDTANGLVSSVVICEGCGPIQVDHNGACVSVDCLNPGHSDLHLANTDKSNTLEKLSPNKPKPTES